MQDIFENPDFTRFYDWLYEGFKTDLPMYLKLAEENGSPILDVACGTGREAIALARAGFEVTGLDISEPMLNLARRKILSEPENVRNRIKLFQKDMRDFRFAQTFPCVFVPHASLFHILDSQALRDCLACLFNHIKSGGVLCIDLVSPHRMANQEVGKLRKIREGLNPVTGLFTTEFNLKLEIDRNLQFVRVEHCYIEKEEKAEKRSEYIQSYRWIEEEEGLGLLSDSGFSGLQTFGDYNLTPFSKDSPRLIFLARKTIS